MSVAPSTFAAIRFNPSTGKSTASMTRDAEIGPLKRVTGRLRPAPGASAAPLPSGSVSRIRAMPAIAMRPALPAPSKASPARLLMRARLLTIARASSCASCGLRSAATGGGSRRSRRTAAVGECIVFSIAAPAWPSITAWWILLNTAKLPLGRPGILSSPSIT